MEDKDKNITQEVFDKLKGSITDMTLDHLEDDTKKALGVLASTLETDQVHLRQRALQILKDIEKEKEIINAGYTKYFVRDELKGIMAHYSATNNTNILFAELETFKRVIPKRNRDDIQKAKKSELFATFFIMYTDYTNDGKLKTKSKNNKVTKDPIVFATPNTPSGKSKFILSERLYVITDWADEFCDVDLTKLINSLDETEYRLYDARVNNDIDVAYILKEFDHLEDEELVEKLIQARYETSEHPIPKRKHNLLKSMYRAFIGWLNGR